MINVSKELAGILGREPGNQDGMTHVDKARADILAIPPGHIDLAFVERLADNWVKERIEDSDRSDRHQALALISANTDTIKVIVDMIHEAHAIADGKRSPDAIAEQMVLSIQQLIRIWSTMHYGLNYSQHKKHQGVQA